MECSDLLKKVKIKSHSHDVILIEELKLRCRYGRIIKEITQNDLGHISCVI